MKSLSLSLSDENSSEFEQDFSFPEKHSFQIFN